MKTNTLPINVIFFSLKTLLTKSALAITNSLGLSQNGSEHEQGIIRLVIISAIFAYLVVYYKNVDLQMPIFWALYLTISIALLAHIHKYPNPNKRREYLSLFLDLSATSYTVYITNEVGAVFLCVYLWLIIGYGLRYGKTMMRVAYFSSMVFFVASYTMNPVWHSHMPIFYGLLTTLIVIPLHNMRLLSKLNIAIEKAEQASQAKSQFLSHMSHEIRTPLNGIVGAASLFAGTDDKNEQVELLNIVKSSSELLLELVNNVLDLSQIESGKINSRIEIFNLNELLSYADKIFRSQLQSKGITLNTYIDNETPFKLQGEYLHIKQVLINLVGNAVKFTNEGEVSIKVKSQSLREGHAVVRFEVQDTGIGIADSALNRIFESFTQADETIKYEYGGTGLGMTISKNLVTAMHGKIGVDSHLGKGSTFWFEIPLQVVEDSPRISNINIHSIIEYKKQPKQAQRSLKVLIAEDNAVNSRILTQMLAKAHYTYDLVDDGEKALDQLETNQYDVIILDSNMPTMGGLEVTRFYNTLNLGQALTPIIILSADATQASVNKALKAGAKAYLTKPVQIDLLLNTINELVEPEKTNGKVVSVADYKSDKKYTEKNRTQYLDHSRIKSLKMLSENNQFYNQMVEDFKRDTKVNLILLSKAIEKQDYKSITDCGHAIAGSAINMGLVALHDSALKIDNVKTTMTMVQISMKYEKLIKVFEATIIALLDESNISDSDVEAKNKNLYKLGGLLK